MQKASMLRRAAQSVATSVKPLVSHAAHVNRGALTVATARLSLSTLHTITAPQQRAGLLRPTAGRTFAADATTSTPSPPKLSLMAMFGAPPIALLLGAAGLVPFVGLAPPVAAMLPLPESLAANPVGWQITYGASILSFLGGVHWGACLQGGPHSSSLRLIWSVVPSLVAWAAVALPPLLATPTLAGALLLANTVDQKYARVAKLPPWYAALRLPLTFVATLSLLSSAVLTGNPELMDRLPKYKLSFPPTSSR